MANCSIETLQQMLLDILEEDESNLGVPLKIARRKLLSKSEDRGMKCGFDMIDETIKKLLGNWIIDKTLAPLSVQLEENLNLEPPGPFWRLKILTPEMQDKYKSLPPVKKALIQLLREQNEPGRRGQIPIKEAEKILSNQGFENVPEDMWIRDVLKITFKIEGEEVVDYYFLVQEHMKTEEFKKQEQKMLDESLEKQRRYIELMEDLENESKQEADET